jgi:uncharacterized protein
MPSVPAKNPSLVNRPEPLNWLQLWRDRDIIKVVTGARRVGKSTLLELYRAELAADGVPQKHIVTVNLEDPSLSHLLGDHQALYNYIRGQVASDATTYVFIDEIQNVAEFERVVDGLYIIPGVDLYLTGSSSQLLSGALATLLTGRYVEYHLKPFSFAEFVSAKHSDADPPIRDLYDQYVRTGGFPFAVALDDDDQVSQYLEGIINTILLADVSAAKRVANPAQLRAITEFVFANIGNLSSVKRISDAMTSAGRSISRPTVESYLSGLTDAFLVYPARRWDIRGKRLLEAGEKHYVVDTGMRRALLGARPVDAGHILENLVYVELLRRPGKVYAGKIDSKEVDFVVENELGTTYVQVCLNVDDPTTLERELAPLRAIPGFERRVLLTADREPPQSYDGIRRMSAYDFLLGEPLP